MTHITDAQVEAALGAFNKIDDDTGDHWEAIRAALEVSERAAWRPIEEAPKDGTPIDVTRQGATGVAVATWDDDRYAKVRPRPFWHFRMSGKAFMRANPPTHWRPRPSPLPPPPEEAGR